MLADAHLHLFRSGYPGPDGTPIVGERREVDVYNELRSRHGIVAGLVVGYESGGIDEGNNSYLRGLAATNAWLSSVAYVEPAPPPTPAMIEHLLAQGHVGVAIYLPDAAAAEAVSAWPRAVWDTLDRRRALISLNTRPEATAVLGPTIDAVRGASFLFAHLGLPGASATSLTQEAVVARLAPLLKLADLAHVHVKLSGLYAARTHPDSGRSAANACVDHLLERFGTGRCLWGSDFSPALGFETFEETLRIDPLDRLTGVERNAIMGGNLMDLLRAATSRQPGVD